MNIYCNATLHQIQFAVKSITELMDLLGPDDLLKRPTANKLSIGELLGHIALICKADSLIAEGATQEEMSDYYSQETVTDLAQLKEVLMSNYLALEERYSTFTNEELHQKMPSYWGAAYTRYEWLLEILTHLYHHRGQLHAMLVHCLGKDPSVKLFE